MVDAVSVIRAPAPIAGQAGGASPSGWHGARGTVPIMPPIGAAPTPRGLPVTVAAAGRAGSFGSIDPLDRIGRALQMNGIFIPDVLY